MAAAFIGGRCLQERPGGQGSQCPGWGRGSARSAPVTQRAGPQGTAQPPKAPGWGGVGVGVGWAAAGHGQEWVSWLCGQASVPLPAKWGKSPNVSGPLRQRGPCSCGVNTAGSWGARDGAPRACAYLRPAPGGCKWGREPGSQNPTPCPALPPRPSLQGPLLAAWCPQPRGPGSGASQAPVRPWAGVSPPSEAWHTSLQEGCPDPTPSPAAVARGGAGPAQTGDGLDPQAAAQGSAAVCPRSPESSSRCDGKASEWSLGPGMGADTHLSKFTQVTADKREW